MDSIMRHDLGPHTESLFPGDRGKVHLVQARSDTYVFKPSLKSLEPYRCVHQSHTSACRAIPVHMSLLTHFSTRTSSSSTSMIVSNSTSRFERGPPGMPTTSETMPNVRTCARR